MLYSGVGHQRIDLAGGQLSEKAIALEDPALVVVAVTRHDGPSANCGGTRRAALRNMRDRLGSVCLIVWRRLRFRRVPEIPAAAVVRLPVNLGLVTRLQCEVAHRRRNLP